jgi:hypothetical protein
VVDLGALTWDAMDAWFEEVFVHPRDPYTRIDVLRSSRHVVVHWENTVVADTTRPPMLLESGLPPRWHLQPEDVRTDLLASATRPGDTATRTSPTTGRCGTATDPRTMSSGLTPSPCTTPKPSAVCSASTTRASTSG